MRVEFVETPEIDVKKLTVVIESSTTIALFKVASLISDEEIALDTLEAGEADFSRCRNVYGFSLGLEFRSGILGWSGVDV